MTLFFIATNISRRCRLIMLATVAVVTLWFTCLALATPFDHDESQYVAAALLSTKMLIFRDFLYLQTPLHAWLYAPIALTFSTTMVMAMRLVTAMTAIGTLAALWMAQRRAGISPGGAAIATLLIATTAAFQFTASVVRNDMLPTLLSSIALCLMMTAVRERDGRGWFLPGLLFGLAIAAKLNFAPMGLAAGLFAVIDARRHGPRAAVMLAGGALVGMLPLLVIGLDAPEAFLYGILHYGAVAPHAWYAANGAGDELTAVEKLTDLAKYLCLGPALIALLAVLIHTVSARSHWQSSHRRLTLFMMGGALIGAALPTPTQVQYLMPLLVPLTLALGYLLDDARRWKPARRRALLGTACLMTIAGLWESTGDMVAMMRHGSPVVHATSTAHWAGQRVRAMTGEDTVVTLSPHLMADSGLSIDPRVATGPFVYRSGWTITADQARRINVLIPATINDLDRKPPASILVGYEAGTRNLPLRPDDGLIAYAQRRNYRMVPMPDGIGRLYVRPTIVQPSNTIHEQ